MDANELALTARIILGTAPKDRDEGTRQEAHRAGVAARALSDQRVAAPYRSWELQRAFIAGWNGEAL